MVNHKGQHLKAQICPRKVRINSDECSPMTKAVNTLMDRTVDVKYGDAHGLT
jgi:hypothetical protein